jgi:hypothetical protein
MWQGKEHGLSFSKFHDGTEDYVLYENGERKGEFTAEAVLQIKAGTLDWTKLFTDPQSRINITPNQRFDGPADWEERFNAMLKEVQASVDRALVQEFFYFNPKVSQFEEHK